MKKNIFYTIAILTVSALFTLSCLSNQDKIILCTFVTPSHEVLLNDWLLPSAKKYNDFEIIIGKAPQECPTASFMKQGWTKTTKKKVLHVIDTIKKNMGRIMIFADADIQFFGSIESIIRKMLQKNDFIIQKNNPQGDLCTGFFALNCNEINLALWNSTYKYMLADNKKSDQISFNYILKTYFDNEIMWSYLPTNYFIGGGTFNKRTWNPGDTLITPDTTLMHHANHTKGINNKISQLKYVKTELQKRSMVAIDEQVWLSKGMKSGPRKSSAPYITGDSFRDYADHVVDYPFTSFNCNLINKGDTIFVYPPYLNLFFTQIHPKIKYPYILITGNADHSIPLDTNYKTDFTQYLDDPKLIAWFGRNITGSHWKLYALPIGITNAYYPDRSNITLMTQLKNNSNNKKHLLYMNFHTYTNKTKRAPVKTLFKNKVFCYKAENLSCNHYFQDIAESKFVLSPEGNGIDCHRTWEALMIGSIPIILSSPLNSLYEDLPVLIVDDWTSITEEFLNKKYEEFQTRTFNLEKLYMPYWINKIEQIKKKN